MSDTESPSARPTIDRAKTALSRNNFSRPVQHLLETGMLHKDRSFFDYGCGRGDDVAGLTELGFRADGWDPVFRPDTSLQTADIVNLGFVLNVIEDPGERDEALVEAWNLATGTLVVSAISVWERPQNGLQAFSDGHVTQRGTFQRYYEPGELKEYVDKTLGVEAVPASPTLILCFKDSELALEYLAESGRSSRGRLPTPSHPLRKSRVNQCLESFRAANPDTWLDFASSAIEHAAPPPLAAVNAHQELTQCSIRPTDVLGAFMELYGEDEWKTITKQAQDRFLSRLALAFFRGKPRAKHYSIAEREAIKYHFSSFREAVERAQTTLYAIGDPEIIARECAATDVGEEDEQALYVQRDSVPELSAILQTYVGAGRLFYGDLSDVDVFKIHKASGKLTLLLYDSYQDSDRPTLQTRVKIDYRSRRILFFDQSRRY